MGIIYPRWQSKILHKALKTRRVILISGARQCGKTTLAKQLNLPNTSYRTLDDLALKELAENDPRSFVKHQEGTLIIDEIQRVPSLLSAIKIVVDENNRPGQYLLTGSANIQSLPSVQESLAGRIRKLRLRPLSLGEVLKSNPNFLNNAFNQIFQDDKNLSYNRRDLLEIAFRGGFPEALRLQNDERSKWHRDYINALLERDLLDIARVQRLDVMRSLVNTLAAWSGKFMELSSICTNLAISRPTLETYINALETLFIIERVPPWTRTDYQRIGKHAKLFMIDSGFMASILRWNINNVEIDPDRSGKLIETFIFNEISSQVDVSDDKYYLYHYRDREQREIDFLIERADDLALLGIEVKAGSAISPSDFKHLKWFKDNLANDRPFVGIVLYTGQLVGRMGDNLWAVPFRSLWS